MIKVFTPILTDKESVMGAEVSYDYLFLPDHGELYLRRTLSQLFKLGWFKRKVVVESTTVPMYNELIAPLSLLLDEPTKDNSTFVKLIHESWKSLEDTIKSTNTKMYDALAVSSEEDQKSIKEALKAGEDYMSFLKKVTAPLKTSSMAYKSLTSFIKSGYVPVFTEELGASATYTLIRVMDDRIVLMVVDSLVRPTSNTIQMIKEFSLPYVVLDKFLTMTGNKITKGKE